ncbi:MAG: ABC transporter ATP-binding protein/permease [Alphaproteobacteria bacterium]|nr:ABC transporter ATP-binding protein/permease [Alphaproteobacteria bacterium]
MAERMDRSMYRFVLQHSGRQQLYILIFVVISWPVGFMLFDVPKQIINRALGGEGPPFSASVLGLFDFVFDGSQTMFLVILCVFFLFLVFVNNGLKFHINTSKGRTAERLLRRLRYSLFSRVLRFPISHFKRTSQGEVISMITAESEPIGAFFVGAVVDPVFLSGQLIVAIGFIIVQDPLLGVAAAALYPIQIYVVPRLQKKVSALGKARLREIRRLSDHVGETVNGIVDIHVNDTSNLELSRFADRLSAIYNIRFEIFQRKYMIKALNNILDKAAPFLFYLFGGILVIEGNITIGALVAVIGAHKDMSTPWKELLNWYQQQADARVKYEQVVSQFDPDGMLDEELQHAEPEGDQALDGSIELSNVSLVDEDDVRRIAGVTLDLAADNSVAVVGGGSSGKDYLALLLARLAVPTGGQISIAGKNLIELPEAVTGRRIAFAGSTPFLQSASVRDNLVYGLKHRPLRPPEYDTEQAKKRNADATEAQRAGNIVHDYNADWVDYEAAGVEKPEELFERMLEIFDIVELSDDIYQLGLRGTIDPAERPDIAEAVLKARAAMADRLHEPAYSDLVELFDRGSYNTNASVAENLLFGTPVGDTFDIDWLPQHPYVLETLRKSGLVDDLISAGRSVAETMIEIFADLPPGHEFFEQYSFIGSDELPEFRTLLSRTDRRSHDEMTEEDRVALMSLPFKLIVAQHRLGVVTEELQQKILTARDRFAAELPSELGGAVEFFDSDTYNAAAPLQDNILFGKLAYGQAEGPHRVGALIAETLDDLHLRGSVMEAGLEFQVGVGGGRLSTVQRQKLSLARALLKRPDLLIANEATSAMDPGVQDRIAEAILTARGGKGVVWIVNRASMAAKFDRVVVFAEGRVAEQGDYNELDRDGTALHEMLQSA